MAESWGRILRPLVDGLFYEFFVFGTFFGYHDFQNEIDAWETTVPSTGAILPACHEMIYIKKVVHFTRVFISFSANYKSNNCFRLSQEDEDCNTALPGRSINIPDQWR